MNDKQKKEQAQKQMEVLQVEMDKLKAIIDAPEPMGRFIPKHGQGYFYIQTNGQITELMYFAGDETCTHHKVIGNCYETKEHAEQVAENRRTHIELQDLADEAWVESGKTIDWGDTMQNKIYALLDSDSTIDFSSSSFIRCPSCVYFPYFESWEKATKKIGHERLKKYLEIGII